MEYCFAKGHDFLSSPDFFSPFPEAVRATQCTIHVLMHFPWILPVLKALPYFLLPTGMMAMVDFRRVSRLANPKFISSDEKCIHV
jgi:hypothetical protein